jgi:hypothetical protein
MIRNNAGTIRTEIVFMSASLAMGDGYVTELRAWLNLARVETHWAVELQLIEHAAGAERRGESDDGSAAHESSLLIGPHGHPEPSCSGFMSISVCVKQQTCQLPGSAPFRGFLRCATRFALETAPPWGAAADAQRDQGARAAFRVRRCTDTPSVTQRIRSSA